MADLGAKARQKLPARDFALPGKGEGKGSGSYPIPDASHLMYILDAEGQPVSTESVEEWGRFLESNERIVASDTVRDVYISTMFLGVDHDFGRRGSPILWETMIFGGVLDGTQERYSSRKAAIVGHRRWLFQVMDAHHAA